MGIRGARSPPGGLQQEGCWEPPPVEPLSSLIPTLPEGTQSPQALRTVSLLRRPLHLDQTINSHVILLSLQRVCSPSAQVSLDETGPFLPFPSTKSSLHGPFQFGSNLLFQVHGPYTQPHEAYPPTSKTSLSSLYTPEFSFPNSLTLPQVMSFPCQADSYSCFKAQLIRFLLQEAFPDFPGRKCVTIFSRLPQTPEF